MVSQCKVAGDDTQSDLEEGSFYLFFIIIIIIMEIKKFGQMLRREGVNEKYPYFKKNLKNIPKSSIFTKKN